MTSNAELVAARPPDVLPNPLSETTFQEIVLAYARRHHWRVCHIPAVPVVGRMITPYDGHAGLPDLILARDGRVLLAELKSRNGRPTKEQRAWLDAAAPHCRLWTPNDWPAIVADLD